nr:unnamed protein product [Callosobruchus chinensis]CAH7721640.1 unnamed protein product [Callosobruchus chinensis]CAH7730964.1 unnamed protein product [Callosobruchus chinensis]CAH7732414.1 unnamed protein product [Callosobruchus chinensis]CAH7738378.1 unnamed protein product [Callosobruchus chinensis]
MADFERLRTNKEAATIARTFVDNFGLRYGIPQRRAPNFSLEYSETYNLLNVKQLNSTAYHHQTLGSLENTHKCLGDYLRIQVSHFLNSWSSWVSYWCFAYNTTVYIQGFINFPIESTNLAIRKLSND